MMRKAMGRWSVATVILIMMVSLFFQVLAPVKAEAAQESGTVTFSIERFTLGQGFYVEPIEVPFEEGDTGYDLLMKAVPDAKNVLNFTDNDTYLAWIAGCDLGQDKIKVPDYIFDISDGELTTEGMAEYGNDYENNGLGEFSYSQWSGWMYSVNNAFPGYGLDQYKPQDGDVVRWQFTLYGHGTDVEGKAFGETEYRVMLSNKDEAMKLLAKVNGDKALLDDASIKWAYDKTKEIVQNPVAPQADVDSCVATLRAAIAGKGNVFPESIALDSTAREVYLDSGSFKLTATLSPEDAIMNTITWDSSAPEVATVDQAGNVTPKAGGETVITAKTANGLTAECRVTVKTRPITGLTLKPTALQMVVGSTGEIQAQIMPDNTTDSKTLVWRSSDPEVASVEDGHITALNVGEAVITAETVNGLTAECKVTISADYEKMTADLKAQIAALPETGSLTLADEAAVVNAQAVYDSLPENYKNQLTAEERAKLEASVKVMAALKDNQQKVQSFTEKVNALLDVAQITTADNAQVKALVDVVNTWDSLTADQKTSVDSGTLEKYKTCAAKVQSLKKEVAAVNDKIMDLQPLIEDAGRFNLGDVGKVTAARSAYNALCPFLQDVESVKAGWLDENAGSVLIYAERLVRSAFTAEIEALDISDEASVVNFINAMKLYEAMPEDQQPVFNAEVSQTMAAGKQNIAAKYQKSNELTVSGADLPWYVKLVVTEKTSDTGLRQDAADFYGAGSELRKAYAVSFEEIDTGKTYLPEGKLDFTLSYKAGDGEDVANFKIFRQDSPERGAGLLEKALTDKAMTNLEALDYDAQSGLWRFSTEAPCTFGLVYQFIPLTGISIEAQTTEIEAGASLTLKAKPVPENATLGDEGLEVTWRSSDTAVATVDALGNVRGLKAGQSVVITAEVKDQPDIKASITLKVKASAAVSALRDSLNPSVKQMLQETANYVVNAELTAEQAQAGSIGYSSQWNVLAIARARDIAQSAGMDTSNWDTLIKTFYNNAAGQYKKDGGTIPGDGDRKKTEYSKFILTLTACGYDATAVSEDKYNVFDNLRDFKKVKAQGTNGPIWALIALKCSDKYQGALPTTEAEAAATGLENPTSEEKLLNFVLDSQLADGGWALSGSKADSDMTGMGLQALWAYYTKADSEKTDFERSVTDRVNTAVERGLSCLRNLQMDSGGYGSLMSGSGSQETEESICQVVVALTGLGLEPADSANGFVKSGGKWTMSALTRYYIAGGGFMHILPGGADDGGGKPGERNGMATEQGLYTLVAYQRLIEGKNGLYNMNDEKIEGGQAASGQVTSSSGTSGIQNGSGKGGVSKGGGQGSGKQQGGDGQQNGNGWNFDTLMAKNDKSAGTGLSEEQLKNVSLLLGLCGIGILALFMIIRGVYNLCIKP